MFGKVVKKVFGSKNERELKRLFPVVERVNALEKKYAALSDVDLAAQSGVLKERLAKGESLTDILEDAFATCREASKRVLGMRHFDVQILGGVVLHEGTIAEMKTGEGKTLTATLPVYLNALAGKGVHVVTVNDSLARRDAEWMGRLYGFLGLSTGVIVTGLEPEDRQAQYAADITYGQNNEFGFDFLRDNMKLELSEMSQRGHFFAIVDEVDSILVDESRTPLIISGPSENPTETYGVADQLIRRLKLDKDFTVDLKTKQVSLTEEGVQTVEKLIDVENLYDPRCIELVHHLNQAMKAHVVMQRDVDYVVREGQVIIVDEFTGRLMAGRRWSDGLHQAVEAKEGVKIARENQTLATITFQNYFRMYSKLAGMTGTADTEAVEFKKIYNLNVTVIPTNQSMIRKDFPDVVYSTEKAKFDAVCQELEELVAKGQPVLVGTASIARSEQLSGLLEKRGIAHHVLNAKQHEREAEIVAQAGRFGMVTISTNMAGRGTDILLGGNPEFLAAAAAGTRDPNDPVFQEKLVEFRKVCAEEKKKVVEVGGLHILGTERHESRRIDNQLRGRAGRQGDPGSSRFYVSLEDDLMKRFGGERIQAIMSRVGLRDDEAIAGKMVASAIENAQKKVEGYHFDVRKHLLEYDDVMNKQRQVIYSRRDKLLRAEEIETEIRQMIGDVIEDIIAARAPEKSSVNEWDVEGMLVELNRNFGLQIDHAPFLAAKEQGKETLAQDLYDTFSEAALARYDERSTRFGPDRMRKLERVIYLQAIDYFWKEHLANMDHLKEGIGLRGYGQKNPLHEYQRESYELFSSMMFATNLAVLQNVFIPDLPSDDEIRQLEERERELQRLREAQARASHQDVVAPEPVPEVVESEDTSAEGRNRRERRMNEQRASKDGKKRAR